MLAHPGQKADYAPEGIIHLKTLIFLENVVNKISLIETFWPKDPHFETHFKLTPKDNTFLPFPVTETEAEAVTEALDKITDFRLYLIPQYKTNGELRHTLRQ